MRRGYARPLWVGVAVSVLLHALLFAGVNWPVPQWVGAAEPLPIEARLVEQATSPPPAAPLPRPKPPSPRPKPVIPPPLPDPAVSEEVPAEGSTVAEVAPDPQASAPVAPPEAGPGPVPDEPAPPSLNPLPPRLDMRFQLRYGLARGEQTLVWVNEGDGYTLTSVAAATGLAGVFYQGRFMQTSRGRVTPHGLQPQEFWDQRGDKRSSARFDAASGTLTLNPSKGAPRHFAYQGEVQDALSLFFQLALTAPPPEGRLTYMVFNGKKLRSYTYEVRGEETLETALGRLHTLHLARVDGEGRFEAWLAIDRHYLPVRVLRSDEGSEMELVLESISP